MRDHATIVRDHGAVALARSLNARGFNVHHSTPQRWADRGSIPGEYWKALADEGIASLAELAAAADPRETDGAYAPTPQSEAA